MTAAQLNNLARYVATWSQIDFLLTHAVAMLSKSKPDITGVELEGMAAGARVERLRDLVSQVPNDQARSDATALCDTLGKLVARRNHVMHGVWGLFVDRKDNKALPACFYGPNKDNPIFATELPAMTGEVAKAARGLGKLLGALTPAFSAGVPPRRFFFSDGPPAGPPPEWHP